MNFGDYCWVGTIAEFLKLDRGQFLDAMTMGTRRRLAEGALVGHGQREAWRDEFRHLRRELSKLGERYKQLHIAFEYILPGHPNDVTGKVEYCKVPDAMIFGRAGVLVLEFKQREPPPYDGFARETRGYLRLIEKWHPGVPRMTAQGALVLTKAMDFGKHYPRVRAISPDRIPARVRKVFGENCEQVEDAEAFLKAIGG